MYEAHERYRKVIAEDVMKNRPLNISRISQNYDVHHAFKYLGAHTPEVIIKQSDIQYKRDKYSNIEEIVRLIGKRCSNGNLKKVTITFDAKETGANTFRTEMPNVLLNIESLTIVGPMGSSNRRKKAVHCDEFLVALKGHKWSSLTLKNMKDPETLLKFVNVAELRKLSIEKCQVSSTEFWPDFFKNGVPALESLSWIDTFKSGVCRIDPVDFAKAFPGLKRLRLGGKYGSLNVSTLPKLTSLELREVVIFSGDLLPIVTALQNSNNSIEELSFIRSNSWSSGEIRSSWSKLMQMCTNLHTIKFDHHKYYSCDWANCIHFIEQIPNVANVELVAKPMVTQGQVVSLVKKSKMRSIKIRSPDHCYSYFRAPFQLTYTFYNKLVNYRKTWLSDLPPIAMYMDIDATHMEVLKRNIGDYNTKSNHIRLHRLRA